MVRIPNLIGIGTMKSGSSYFFDLLNTHKDIFMSEKRKEISFFDNNFTKGLKWYKTFFKNAVNEKYVGEFTPNYIYDKTIPKKIKNCLGDDVKFLIIIRCPVDRAYSHYKHALIHRKTNDKFRTFLDKREDVLKKGLYYDYISYWFKHFKKENFHIVIFENLIKNPSKELESVAKFLSIDPNGFSYNTKKDNNESIVPRSSYLFVVVTKIAYYLRWIGLDFIVNKMRGFILKLFGKSTKFDNIKEVDRDFLYSYYEHDIIKLENLLKLNLKMWKK